MKLQEKIRRPLPY